MFSNIEFYNATDLLSTAFVIITLGRWMREHTEGLELGISIISFEAVILWRAQRDTSCPIDTVPTDNGWKAHMNYSLPSPRNPVNAVVCQVTIIFL